MLSWR